MSLDDPARGRSEPVRLSKRVAAMVPCSRSEAERYIEGGWVRVEGKVVDVPQTRVAPAQSVTLDPEASRLALTPVTVLAHEMGDGQAVLPAKWRKLQALVPLPEGAGGLAVYSQDFRIVRKLTEDAFAIEQEWVVQVEGQIAEGGLARLERLAAPQTARPAERPPLKASWQSERRLRLAFKGMDPAHIPWLCEQVNLKPMQGRRIRLGRLPLASLPPGQWRTLLPHERF